MMFLLINVFENIWNLLKLLNLANDKEITPVLQQQGILIHDKKFGGYFVKGG